MLKKRMILCLLMNRHGVFFNSRNFKLQAVGELDWVLSYLSFKAIDELVLLNIDRESKSVPLFAEQMRKLAKSCFVPITAGGGVTVLEDFEVLLDSGADKVSINSEAYRNPDFVERAAGRYGSQCVVASVDFKRVNNKQMCYFDNGTIQSSWSVLDWVREVSRLGAGEIFLTSIDRDGVGNGYDLDVLKKVSSLVTVPVIASGGVGEFEHLAEGISIGSASAVSAANIFHHIGYGLEKAKVFIAGQGVDVPTWNFKS